MTLDRKSAVFRIDIGGISGLGHASRSITLAQNLQLFGYKPELVIHRNDDCRDYLTNNGYRPHLSSSKIGTEEDINFVSTIAGGKGANLIVIDNKFPEDLILADYRASSYALVNIQDRPIVCNADVIVNQNLSCDISQYPSDLAASVYTGLKTCIISKVWRDIRNSRKHTNFAGTPHILITFGGEDPKNHSLQILNRFSRFLEGYHLDVVIGPSHPSPQSLNAIASQKDNVRLFSNLSNLSDLAAAAEMAITAAGLTSLELSSAGIPTAVVAIEPHQLDFMCCLVEQGLVFPLSENDQIQSDRLEEFCFNNILREKLAKSADKYFLEDGSLNLARELNDFAFKKHATSPRLY